MRRAWTTLATEGLLLGVAKACLASLYETLLSTWYLTMSASFWNAGQTLSKVLWLPSQFTHTAGK
ncbi:hypothetical protein, partial [Acinetobacter baumannii]|uniref:hypothetical protein n=1 Tax=Acinetobacter baumannii TaxID=470 RepID=UPI00197ADC4C